MNASTIETYAKAVRDLAEAARVFQGAESFVGECQDAKTAAMTAATKLAVAVSECFPDGQ